VDELKEVNLDIVKNPHPTFINANLSPKNKGCIELLMKYRDIFSWSYDEMLGLNLTVAIHQLSIINGTKLVKQA